MDEDRVYLNNLAKAYLQSIENANGTFRALDNELEVDAWHSSLDDLAARQHAAETSRTSRKRRQLSALYRGDWDEFLGMDDLDGQEIPEREPA